MDCFRNKANECLGSNITSNINDFNIIGVSKQQTSIGIVRPFIDHTCVNNINGIANQHAFDPMRKTREAYILGPPVACTETDNNIVPMCVKEEKLRDGETVYFPYAKKRVKVEVKHLSACRYCGNQFEASGIIIHESRCKSAPSSRNSNADHQSHLQRHDHDLCPFFFIIVVFLLIIFLIYLATY